jgi:transcriptional regulator NrdR family protein
MNCPKCGKETLVIDSRPSPGELIRRRRICNACSHRFTTYEITEIRKAEYERSERHEKELIDKMNVIYQFASQSLLEG